MEVTKQPKRKRRTDRQKQCFLQCVVAKQNTSQDDGWSRCVHDTKSSDNPCGFNTCQDSMDSILYCNWCCCCSGGGFSCFQAQGALEDVLISPTILCSGLLTSVSTVGPSLSLSVRGGQVFILPVQTVGGCKNPSLVKAGMSNTADVWTP